MRVTRGLCMALATIMLAMGTWQLAGAGWVHAKALLAQRLIASAWTNARDGGRPRRPWPGADMRPVARLTVPQRSIELYVLDNATARALAFGPAHVGGTALPGGAGNSVIVAHRDTHFAFLRDLQLADEIEVEGQRGVRARYRVSDISVVQQDETRVLAPADAAQLTLITCWPFDAVMPGTPLRYVVIAERIG
jgi:sortase A